MANEQTRDIATVFGDAYSRSAPRLLGEQHEFLLNALESHFQNNPNENLLIVGPGGQVLPYSCSYTENGELGDTNRKRIKKIIGDGKIILLDYISDEDKGGLDKGFSTLDSMGFFEKDYFKLGEISPRFIEPSLLEKNSISFLENNLRDPLRINDESIDAIDANLSVHHASVTREELERVYSEFFRILTPGGLLHLGEGNVDMNYSEDKTIRIGSDLSSILNASILISDKREKGAGYTIKSFFEPGKKYVNLPVVKENFEVPEEDVYVEINEEGIVTVFSKSYDSKTPQLIRKSLEEIGYITLHSEVFVAFPLIDPQMTEDSNGLTIPVDTYYDAIKNKAILGYQGIDDKLVAQISGAIEFERGNAKRGLVEYYMGEKTIVGTLERIGFTDIQVVHNKTEPFYNITAYKPE